MLKDICVDSKAIKTCSKCGISKPLDEYGKRKDSMDGHCGRCIICSKKINKEYEKSNKGLAYRRKYNENNTEERKEYQKLYHKDNKIKINQYYNDRRKTDPNYKIKCTLRTRICHALYAKEGNRHKYYSTIKLLGISINEFITYLESLFTENMTWENYGEWHIDHKQPCASFDLTNPEEQKKCFHYSNTQPLWAKDNMKKGTKTA